MMPRVRKEEVWIHAIQLAADKDWKLTDDSEIHPLLVHGIKKVQALRLALRMACQRGGFDFDEVLAAAEEAVFKKHWN